MVMVLVGCGSSIVTAARVLRMMMMGCRPDGNKYMEAVHLAVLLDLLEAAGIQSAFGRTCLYFRY